MASQHPQISKISQQSRNGSVVTVVPCQISIQEKGRKSPVISKRALFNIFAPGIAHCGKKREQIFGKKQSWDAFTIAPFLLYFSDMSAQHKVFHD
jgi:hypothetical protein